MLNIHAKMQDSQVEVGIEGEAGLAEFLMTLRSIVDAVEDITEVPSEELLQLVMIAPSAEDREIVQLDNDDIDRDINIEDIM